MVKLRPKPGEKIDKTLRRFKRLCENEGIMRDFRRHEYYETPSQVRRRKRLASIKRREKELREAANPTPVKKG
jgi:small subunit ribosomal protein S21